MWLQRSSNPKPSHHPLQAPLHRRHRCRVPRRRARRPPLASLPLPRGLPPPRSEARGDDPRHLAVQIREEHLGEGEEGRQVPSIVFELENGQEGGKKWLISVQTKQIKKLVDHLGRSFFLWRLFELEIRSDFGENGEVIEKVRALPRQLHLHSGTDAVLNVTFIRAPSSAQLKVDVPLVFRGDDVCPGLR